MEVGDDEVAVVVLGIGGHVGQHQAGEAGDAEQHDEADGEEHGRLEAHRARHMVAIQQKNSTASGSEIAMVLYMK
jgi:hypothetical protein